MPPMAVAAASSAAPSAADLKALGLSEMGAGRQEYAASDALGAASAEMTAAAVRASSQR